MVLQNNDLKLWYGELWLILLTCAFCAGRLNFSLSEHVEHRLLWAVILISPTCIDNSSSIYARDISELVLQRSERLTRKFVEHIPADFLCATPEKRNNESFFKRVYLHSLLEDRGTVKLQTSSYVSQSTMLQYPAKAAVHTGQGKVGQRWLDSK